jgi:hypothetical protein
MAQKRRQIPKRQENVNNPKTASALFITRSLLWDSQGNCVPAQWSVHQHLWCCRYGYRCVSNPHQFDISVDVDCQYSKPVYPAVDNGSVASGH